MKYSVPDMSCGHCTAAIKKAIEAVDPAADVQTDLESRTVTIASSKPDPMLVEAMKSAGYDATPA